MKYEVTTAIKTLIITTDLEEALKVSAEAYKTHKYVEVKKTLSERPYRSESLRILTR